MKLLNVVGEEESAKDSRNVLYRFDLGSGALLGLFYVSTSLPGLETSIYFEPLSGCCGVPLEDGHSERRAGLRFTRLQCIRCRKAGPWEKRGFFNSFHRSATLSHLRSFFPENGSYRIGEQAVDEIFFILEHHREDDMNIILEAAEVARELQRFVDDRVTPLALDKEKLC